MMKNESGRSMVEMLGVLAIIGVLSVGGIAGYTMAMRKYKANEVVSAAAQCVMIARSANMGSGTTGSSACPGVKFPNDEAYDVTSADSTSGTIKVTVADENLCNAAKAIKSGATCSGTNNKDLTITFS